MNTTISHRIQPSGRHLMTIGEELIKDQYAAIIELVKNSYDADSPSVNIIFEILSDNNIKIVVEDKGHGMTYDDVIDKWLVPSTDDKVKRRTSPKGRIMQGRKGIGRYASNILGERLKLTTVTDNGEETIVNINWDDFKKSEYLSDVEINISQNMVNRPKGTTIEILGIKKYCEKWNLKQVENLSFELKKLLPPEELDFGEDKFEIMLTFRNFPKENPKTFTEEIAPFPILKNYHYMIKGLIDSDGQGILIFHNQRAGKTKEEIRFNNSGSPTGCGKIEIDIRVYDRDKSAIDQLVGWGVKDNLSDSYLGNQQTRQLLNSLNGIGVYRNRFRVRPLGDPGNDWLKLNARRVQNPSLRLGSNQVIGYVHVESEEKSGLIETSARDGFVANEVFDNLVNLILRSLIELEVKRFAYRRALEGDNIKNQVESKLEKLSTKSLEKRLEVLLNSEDVNEEIQGKIKIEVRKQDEEYQKAVEEISKIVAIYQGQATLGRIINVVLHEGKHPIHCIKERSAIANMSIKRFLSIPKEREKEKDRLDDISKDLISQANILDDLFRRLYPLSMKKRGKAKEMFLAESIERAIAVFENQIEEANIIIEIKEAPIKVNAWEEDIIAIFVNLIDNSIFWLTEMELEAKEKKILIDMNFDSESGEWEVHIIDTGPGIEKSLLENNLIFVPEFTTKPESATIRSGIGLSISGEAAKRNGWDLRAIENMGGAHFILSPLNADKEAEDEDI